MPVKYELDKESGALRVDRFLNTAMFAAFDKLFVAISRDLGRAAARQMQGEDI